MRLFTLKLFFVSLVAGALMLVGAGAALANTDSTNPSYTVSVNIEPAVATAGTPITANYSVTNNTAQWKFAKLCVSAQINGGTAYSACRAALLPPSTTLALSLSFTLPYSVPGTTVSVGISASDANGTSSASDSIALS
jgi:hypothetical protein